MTDRPTRVICPLVRPALFGVLAQLTQGVISLSLLLVGHAHGIAVGTSALAVAGAALGMAIVRPVQGAALDRFSPRAVFGWFGVAHGAVFGLIAVAAVETWTVVFVLAGVAAGLSLPPVATLMRAVWPQRVDADRVTSMFVFIAGLQMASVLVAPLLFTVADVLAGPVRAMLGVAALAALGTVLFGVVSAGPRSVRRPAARVAVRHYLGPLVLTFLLGVVIGAVQVAAPAVAIAAGRPHVAGLLVAAATVGALLGSVGAMGARGRALPTARLLTISAGLQLVGTSLALLPVALPVTFVGMFLVGVGDAPAFAALSASVAARSRGSAESFGWQSMGQGIGLAVGSAVAGALVALGAHVGVLPALLAAAICAVAGLRSGPPASPDDVDRTARSRQDGSVSR